MAKIKYSPDVDVLNVELKRGKFEISQEIADGIILDLSKDGEILSIEIIDAMKRLTKSAAQRLKTKYTLSHT